MTTSTTPRTLFEKVWQSHLVAEPQGEPSSSTSTSTSSTRSPRPQAFDGLRLAGRKLRRPDRTIATVDHNVPTTSVQDRLVITDQISNAQVNALRKNCAEFGIDFFDVQDADQGIVHMIGPELGATKPGMHHRLRRLPHRHPRSLRRSRLRHRHQRSRARPGHADPAAVQAQNLPHHRRRRTPLRRHRQGHHPRHHRPHRHRRRHRLRHRIRRLRHPRPLHGRPHDRLQHEHRSRSPRRPDRPRRHHLRLPQRPPLLAHRRRVGRGRRPLEDPPVPTPAQSSTANSTSTPPPSRPPSPGAPRPA